MNPQQELRAYLRSLEARVRWLHVSRGSAMLAAAALIMTLLLVWILQRFAFSPASLAAGRFLLFLSLAFALVFGLIAPLLRLNSRRTAARTEQEVPEFQERLTTFADKNVQQNPFLDLLAADALQVAQTAPPQRLVGTRVLAGLLSGAVAAAGVLAWLVLAGPGVLGYGANLLWAGTPKPGDTPYFQLFVSPGNRTVRRNSDQQVTAQVIGVLGSQVNLMAKYAGTAKWEQLPMQAREKSGGYEFLFAGLPQNVEYYVQAGPLRSQSYTLTVIDLPGVKKITALYRYPSWTNLREVSEENAGDLRAVEGTQAQLTIETDRPLVNGLIVLDDNTQIPLTSAGGNLLKATVPIQKDGMYHISAKENNEIVRLTEDYFIEAKKELPPIVKFNRPNRDAKVSPIEEVPVEVSAEDDFGLQELTLRYSVNGGPEQTKSLLPNKNTKTATGRMLLTLEDFKLVPGDLVSMHAVARDARSTVETDIYFVEAQPFEKEYSQSQQSGDQGGGQGEQDNKISERQKEIIAATFNQLKTKQDRAAAAENAKFLSDTQGKLSEQARSLAQRMQRRELSGTNQEFQKFSKDMEEAAAAMGEAVQKLKDSDWKSSLPPEQKALQHLLRAEATFRQIQVAFGRQNGGGQGGGGRELESLFDLELDTEKNQYETGQRASTDQQQKQVDEALQKLEQLARRQQELAQQNQQQKQSFEQRWQQEMLRREAEQLRQQLEQLTRNQNGQQQQQGQQGQQSSQSNSSSSGSQSSQSASSGQQQQQRQLQASARNQIDPRLRQSLERLQQATEDMRRAGQQGDAGSRRAAERLQEARDLLNGMRQQEAGQQLDDLARRADRMAEQQRDFQRRMNQFSQDQAQGRPSPGQSTEQLANEKQQMAGEYDRMERDMQKAARDLAGTQRSASSKLRQTLGEMQQNELGLRMKGSAQWMRRGQMNYARMFEPQLTSGIEQMRDGIKQAQSALGPNDGNKEGKDGKDGELERALSRVEQLRGQLDRLTQQRAANGRQQGQQQGQDGQGRQPGQQQGQQGQQAGQQGNQAGQQQGNQPGQQQGQQSAQSGQQGQQGGQQQGGQQGGGQQTGGRMAGPVGGPRSGDQYGGNWGPNGVWNAGPERPTVMNRGDMERSYRESMQELSQLRQALGSNPELSREVQDLMRQMQRIDPTRLGTGPELASRIESQVLPQIEQLELQLRRKLEEKQGSQMRGGSGERVPAGYADAVADYFRRLSKAK